MKTKYSKLGVVVAFAMAVSLLMLRMPSAATAADCHLDQRQQQNRGEILFGGKTYLAQSFVPGAPGHQICRVKVTIRRIGAAPGPLTLRVLTPAFGAMADPVTIPPAAIPMGVSVQLFDFGCNDAPLNGAFHVLQLESPNSHIGDYAWRGAGANPYAQPGNSGRGWRNVNSGAPANWSSLGQWDFAFEVHTCN